MTTKTNAWEAVRDASLAAMDAAEASGSRPNHG
jgi:hypothetical protein